MKKETREVLALASAEGAVIGLAALLHKILAKPPPALAAAAAKITGTVRDQQTNFAIPYATLTIDTVTCPVNENGGFLIDTVPIGKYTVKATAPGYRPLTLKWNVTEAKEYITEVELTPVETLW